MRDGTAAALRGLAGGWLCPSPTQSLPNPTPIASQLTSWWARGLCVGSNRSTVSRCGGGRDVAALPTSDVTVGGFCAKLVLRWWSTSEWVQGGLARHLTARGPLHSFFGVSRSLGRAATEAVISFQRPRMSGNLVLVEHGHLQPFWALVLATAFQEEAVPFSSRHVSVDLPMEYGNADENKDLSWRPRGSTFFAQKSKDVGSCLPVALVLSSGASGANGSRAIDVVSRDVDGAWRLSGLRERSTCHRRTKKLRCFRCRTRPSLQMPTIAFGTAGVEGAHGEISPLAL